MDTKKKELVGDFKNAGRTWRPQGEPEAVQVYDFLSGALGRAIPYGIYDLAANTGWVRVGVDHDTAAFAGADDPPLVAGHRSPAMAGTVSRCHCSIAAGSR